MSAVASRSGLRLEAWADYAAGTRGDHFAWWCHENLLQGVDRWAGEPLDLEEWQLAMLGEALAVDGDGEAPFWDTVVFVVPRKNAKTTTLGAYALYELDTHGGEPEILLAAGSDKQADKLYAATAGFVRRSAELRERFVAREYIGQIVRADGAGRLFRLSSEGDTQHGANPSLVVADELHVWRSQKLKRSWGALTTADGARTHAQTFAITTEGEAQGREDSILGQLVSANEAAGELEEMPGLTISRDFDSRTLLYRWHAVDAKAADPRPLRAVRQAVKDGKASESEALEVETALLESVMPANPASWITREYILRQALSAKVMPTDFLQLHANIAADSRGLWIGRELWNSLCDPDAEIAAGSEIAVAVDAALTHDSTAVTWAAKLEDGRVVLRSHVWCARAGAAAHEHVAGGRIRNEPVKAFIRTLGQRFHVVEVAYDPRFFEDAAMELSDEGFVVMPLHQGTTPMRDAEQQFHDAAVEGLLAHDGDPVLAAHVASTIAEKTDRGWKIRKLQQGHVIDALVSAVMSHYRARRLGSGAWLAAW